MTLSFAKIKFSADEVLDLITEWAEEAKDYVEWHQADVSPHIWQKFCDIAEQRSREG